MFEKIATEKSIWTWRWPLIVIVVLAALGLMQMARVNSPQPAATERRTYTRSGDLLSGAVTIPAEGYHKIRIDLNRRAKISGEFRTPDVKSRVSVVVIREGELDDWLVGSDYEAIVQTGYVPVGKISPVVPGGTYFLIIDNRLGDLDRTVQVDFAVE